MQENKTKVTTSYYQTIILWLTMVIIDGTCVICAKYKSVLSLGDKHTYLDILKTNLFPEELNRFRKVSYNYIEDN